MPSTAPAIIRIPRAVMIKGGSPNWNPSSVSESWDGLEISAPTAKQIAPARTMIAALTPFMCHLFSPRQISLPSRPMPAPGAITPSSTPRCAVPPTGASGQWDQRLFSLLRSFARAGILCAKDSFINTRRSHSPVFSGDFIDSTKSIPMPCPPTAGREISPARARVDWPTPEREEIAGR